MSNNEANKSNSFQYIRDNKNPDVYKGKSCLYDGNVMRISATRDANLLLKTEIICHPNDPSLIIPNNEVYLNNVASLDKTETIRELRELVAESLYSMPIFSDNESDRQWRIRAKKALEKTLLGIYYNSDDSIDDNTEN